MEPHNTSTHGQLPLSLLGTAPELQGPTWYKMYWHVNCGYTSAKADILARYGKFFKGLRTSPCWEVTVLANLVARDVRSSTGRNIKYVGESSGRDPWHSGTAGLRAGVEKTEKDEVADVDRWREKYLGTLLAQRQECHYLGQEDLEKEVQVLIDSLCVN